MKKRFYNLDKNTLYAILVGLFVGFSLIMNVTSSILIPIINTKWGTITIILALPSAALFMIIADLLSECFNKRQTILAIILGYVLGLLLSLILIIGKWFVGNYEGNNFILIEDNKLIAHYLPWDALSQNWRFLVAGFIAYFTSNFINTGLMWFFKKRHTNTRVWFRVVISSLIGQIVDNTLFHGLAFMPVGLSPLEKNWMLLLFQILVSIGFELCIELLISPITTKLIKTINKKYNTII